MKLETAARIGLVVAFIPITLYLLSLLYLEIFHTIPYVTARDWRSSAIARPDLAALLEQHLYMHELCDPLPCWIQFDIEEVAVLEQPMTLANNASVRRSDLIRIVAVTNRPSAGEPATCPAGSTVVSGTMRRQWWSFLSPAPSQLEGAELVFCIEPDAVNGSSVDAMSPVSPRSRRSPSARPKQTRTSAAPPIPA